MRDPNRIPEILSHLSRVWYSYPDLRLCQLIVNIVPNEQALYYIEDEDFLENLKTVHIKDKKSRANLVYILFPELFYFLCLDL